jgi:hypothetical protein
MSPLADRGRRALRLLRPGRNPLARGSDRVEALTWAATLIALLMAIPVALAVGTVVRVDLAARAHQEATTRHQETAVLVADAHPGEHRVPVLRQVRTPATWAGPDGTVHGEVPAPADARAGETVRVWVDGAGRPVPRPIDGTVVASNALVAGLVTLMLSTTVVGTGQVVVCQVLWRHRARQWTADWAAVEPRWAGRADR